MSSLLPRGVRSFLAAPSRLGAAALVLLAPATWAQTAPDSAYFAAKVYPVLEAAQCRACHSHDGVASGTRLHFPEKDAGQNAIQIFGLSLSPLVDRSDAAKSALLNKPTMRIPHTGGERIKPGSDEDKILTEWVKFLASATDESLTAARKKLGDTATGPKPTQLVRRLTHSQYDNTVRDLLGDFSRPARKFPSEDFVDGFKNQLRMQGMPPLLVENYSGSAEKLAQNAFRNGDVNGLIPCKPVSATDIKCRDQFVRTFGMRAFRRPLRDTEIRRYSAAFTAQARSSGKFNEGARAVVEAMLQSPKFLFHVEAGPDGRYSDYEIASRLSYLLWDTMPDKALLDAAANGELRTPAQREKVARRMLDNPRAREALDEFFNEWLRLDKLPNAIKERRRFPEFTPELAAAMVEETRKLLQHLVWNDKNFMEAFSADYGFLTADLAALYKVPAPKGEFELTTFPASSRRGGILGQGSFLTATSGPAETSATARGLFVREQLLCQHVPPPPAGVNTTLPDPSESKPRTRTQLMLAHVENPSCASCHRLMDPIGFGLEGFDAIGRYREKESIFIAAATDNARAQPKRIDLPLETKGQIAGIAKSEFTDAKQLGRVLAESPVCQECVARQMFRYSYGRLETAADQETIHQLFVRFRDSGFHFQELLIGLVRSPEFLRGLDPKDRVTQAAGNDVNSKQTGGR